MTMTKASVSTMYTEELIHFNNETAKIIEGYVKHGMEVPKKTKQRYSVLQAELKKRKLI